MGDGVVISANANGVETDYTYGLERISAQTGNRKTEYVYDGRGSVAAEVSYNSAWYTLGGALSKKDVATKSYTPFGEQIGEAVSGFGYNGEYYNAATGMVYLRARFYEPEMNRFSQKDILRGNILNTESLNRYTYVQNDPINFVDPSGQSLKSAWNSAKSAVQNAVNTVKTTVSRAATAVKNTVNKVVTTVKNVANKVSNAAKSAYNTVSTAVSNVVNRGTSASSSGSAYRGPSSYSGSSGGGSYTTSPMAYSPYDSNGNAYSYFNSSLDTGKIPSTDAPRIKDVDEETIKYCESGPKKSTSSNYWDQTLRVFVLGDFSGEKQTAASLGLGVLAGIFNADIGLDVRDLVYDLSHISELDNPLLSLSLDALALLPVVGSIKYLKYTDDVADIARHADDVADIARNINRADNLVDAAADTAKHADEVVDIVIEQGFDNYNALKRYLGNAGEGNDWHHIVEQSQIVKSGFPSTQINNTSNIIAIDHATHMKITGYYNTKSFDFTNGLSVRDWLSGQSFEYQREFGLNVLKQFGVIQ